MIYYDYIIIGRGIAGSVLSFQLKNLNYKVLVIDQPALSSSSKVAAGLYNPLVFKKLNKIWNAEIFLSSANHFYTAIEKQTKAHFWHHKDLIRVFSSAGEQNDFELLQEESSYQKYISSSDHALHSKIIAPFGSGVVKSCGFLDVSSFLNQHEILFSADQSILLSEIIPDRDLIYKYHHWVVKEEYAAKKIIFAEGWKIQNNSWFNFLPLIPAKGEVLTIQCDDLPQEYILNGGCFLVPIGNNRFKIGATFNWKDLNDEISEEGKNELIQKLYDVIKVPFQVTNHQAGVRPASKDRRPLLGEHPKLSGIYVFNGLGTRGVVMAPWLAEQLIAFMSHQIALPTECDIMRFNKS